MSFLFTCFHFFLFLSPAYSTTFLYSFTLWKFLSIFNFFFLLFLSFFLFYFLSLFTGKGTKRRHLICFLDLGYRIQHGLADELGDAVGAVAVVVAIAGAVGDADGAVAVAVGGGDGWRDLVPAVEEAPALPLPALTGLAHFYKRINNVFFKETMP